MLDEFYLPPSPNNFRDVKLNRKTMYIFSHKLIYTHHTRVLLMFLDKPDIEVSFEMVCRNLRSLKQNICQESTTSRYVSLYLSLLLKSAVIR